MTKKTADRVRIVVLIILFPMLLATIGSLLNLPNALRALRDGPKEPAAVEK